MSTPFTSWFLHSYDLIERVYQIWKQTLRGGSFWIKLTISGITVAFLIWKTWGQITTIQLELAQPIYLVPALGSVVLAFVLSAWQWQELILPEQRPGFGAVLRWYIMGMFWNNFLPGGVGGDIVRAGSLSTRSRQVEGAIASVMMTRIAGLWSIVLLACASGIWYSIQHPEKGYLVWSIAISAVLAAGISGLSAFILWVPYNRLIDRFSQAKAFRLTLLQDYYRRPGVSVRAILVAIAIQIASVLLNYCMAQVFAIETSFLSLMMAMPLINLISLLPISLGGLGLRESSYYYLLGAIDGYSVRMIQLSVCVYLLILAVTLVTAGFYTFPPVRLLQKLKPGAGSRFIRRVVHLLLGLYRSFQTPETPDDLILYLTDRCNARCGHCFYRYAVDREHSSDRLGFPELEKLSRSLRSPFHSLVLTGGEPFLRTDLVDICRLFWQNARVQMIFLPTNGLMSERIPKQVEAICRAVGSQIYVQISLDGLSTTHDLIRGVPSAFDRAIETGMALKQIQTAYPNLSLTFSTTLSEYNQAELEDLAGYVDERTGLPLTFELVRGVGFPGYNGLAPVAALNSVQPVDARMSPPPVSELFNLYRRLKKIFRKNATHLAGNSRWEAAAAYAYRAVRFYHLADLVARRRSMACPAGKSVGVIYPDGSVALCEFSKPVGNLADTDFKLGPVWRSRQADDMRVMIQGCYCTHGCFQSVAMMHEGKTWFQLLYHFCDYLRARSPDDNG